MVSYIHKGTFVRVVKGIYKCVGFVCKVSELLLQGSFVPRLSPPRRGCSQALPSQEEESGESLGMRLTLKIAKAGIGSGQ